MLVAVGKQVLRDGRLVLVTAREQLPELTLNQLFCIRRAKEMAAGPGAPLMALVRGKRVARDCLHWGSTQAL
jgi:hypothetical protein